MSLSSPSLLLLSLLLSLLLLLLCHHHYHHHHHHHRRRHYCDNGSRSKNSWYQSYHFKFWWIHPTFVFQFHVHVLPIIERKSQSQASNHLLFEIKKQTPFLHDDVIKWKHLLRYQWLLAICAGNSPVSGEFPAERPVTQSFDVFFDLRLNKRLSKQSWGWWFETLSRPLWRRCNVDPANLRIVNHIDQKV